MASGLPERKDLRMKGERSSLLHSAADKRSWSSFSVESGSEEGEILRRDLGVGVCIGDLGEGI